MQYVPRNLYRYRPLKSNAPDKEVEENLLDRLCDEIVERRLFAPDVSKLNDPFEGAGVVPYVASMGSSIPMNLGFLPPSGRDYTHGLRLISLTERYDSPQMWAHYATGYCGACLCFDTSFLEGWIDAVRYSDTPIMEGGYRADDMYSRREEIAPKALLVKQGAWAYEQEWRAVIPEEETEQGFVRYKDGDLWAVIVGHNTPDDAKARIREACERAGARLYVTAPQELRYRLGIWPDGFHPSFDGRTIEQELDEYCEKVGLELFERSANEWRESMEQARVRVLEKASAE